LGVFLQWEELYYHVQEKTGEKMTEAKTFLTTIKNQRKTGVVLWDKVGAGMGVVGPGDERILETDNPETLYAPFSEIIYKADDTVEVKANPDFPAPVGKWFLTAINLDGRDLERRIIGGREVCLPKGLPRVFSFPADDPLAPYVKFEIKKVLERKPSPAWKDYNEFEMVQKDSHISRSEDELEALMTELDKIATDI
jgi:hypothetical protein